MATSRESFNALFEKEYPPESFETKAVYEEYRRSAWMWFRHGYALAVEHETGVKDYQLEG
jgi:hypothetical protein